MSTTTQTNMQSILAELWMNYREDENFENFISYNDLGLPLAYLMHYNIVKGTEQSDIWVKETFNLLLASLEVEDTGFEYLDDIFVAPKKLG